MSDCFKNDFEIYDQVGVIFADCPQFCPEIYSPVCGTNGKTYDNLCELKIASCRNPSIALRYNGACSGTPRK